MNKKCTWLPIAASIVFVIGVTALSADESQTPAPRGFPNLTAPTLGGSQYWADELHFHEYRIQRNVLTGHHRLLDGKDFRHAWGNFEHCQRKLNDLKRERNLPPMSGRAVVLLHGLMGTHRSMSAVETYLREQSGYQVFNVTYPSTQGDLASHADTLARIIERLYGIEEINFVAHSMGNLVIRRYLAEQTDAATGREPDPRIRRIVMLAPPNQGATLAETFKRLRVFQLVGGKSAKQLANDWQATAEQLTIPACEFGIIAGGRGTPAGFCPWIPGDDDLILTVAETRLAGAHDFATVPVIHQMITSDARVLEATLRFLDHGHFISADRRHPIPFVSEQQTVSP